MATGHVQRGRAFEEDSSRNAKSGKGAGEAESRVHGGFSRARAVDRIARPREKRKSIAPSPKGR